MKKLQAKFGYLIHNKMTDTYSERVYLPDNVSLDNFEEVRDETISETIINRMQEVEKKEESLTKVAKVVANQVTDDAVALQIQEFYDEWQVDIAVVVGQYIRHEDVLYKVLTAHTTQANWTPSIATSLFAKVLVDPTGETVLEWEQPDSTNPYMNGDNVIFEGNTYVSTVDNNVWQPNVYGWELIK